MARMVTVEISAKIVTNSGLQIGDKSWELPGFAVENLPHLNPESFDEYLHHCLNTAIEQALDFVARDEAEAARIGREAIEKGKAANAK